MKFMDEFRDKEIAAGLIRKIQETSSRPIQLMEVCGTHTVSIFRYGIRGILPEQIRLISGPGCPVCVTPNHDIDFAIAVSRQKDVIIATFGDMMRVPGSTSSLQKEKAEGGDIRIVYSSLDALKIANENPGKESGLPGHRFRNHFPYHCRGDPPGQRRRVTESLFLEQPEAGPSCPHRAPASKAGEDRWLDPSRPCEHNPWDTSLSIHRKRVRTTRGDHRL